MRKDKRYIKLVTVVFAVALIAGCKISKPVIPSTMEVPATYRSNDTIVSESTDSVGIAGIKWQQYFSDDKLKALIDTAINNNPDLLSAVQRIAKANAALMVSRNAFFPTVDGIAAAGIEKYGDYTMNGVGNYDMNLSPNVNKNQIVPNPTPDFWIGFRTSWEIDLWGKLKNRKKAALARYLKEQKGAQFLKTLLVAQVSGLYYNLSALDNESSIIKRNIKLQEEALEIVKIQKEAGLATELAVQQFNAQLLFTKAAQYRVRQEIVEIENNLNTFLGRFPQSVSRDSLQPVKDYKQQIATGKAADLLVRRPDIREAEFELAAAKADVAAARAAFYPSLKLTPFAGLNTFNSAFLFNGASLAYGVAGGLMAPLFNSKQIQAAHKISIADNKEAYQQYRKTVLNAYSEVVTNMTGIENLNHAYTYKQQEVESLRSAVTVSRDLYVGGRASYLEIISAQKVLLEAEIELNHIQKQQYLTRIDLYRSLGGGWE
ncbi:MAG: efflux transporter outer membrane subunit [Chitinophagaceae bacterium]|nr:MAG: efflux transporter outer membrane subunit [Chitinophagaceae bacterium]